jgi:TonB family protein
MTDYSKDIERYLNGEMTPAERHALEKKSLSDPFLADALEGAELITSFDFEQDVNALNKAIDVKTRKESKNKNLLFWSLRIAAGLVILLIATYLILNLGDEIKSTPNLSDQQPIQKPDTNQLKKDSSTTGVSNNQLALAEEKVIQKKEPTDKLKSAERKNNTLKTPVIEAEKAVAPIADITETEPQVEEIKTEIIAPVITNSSADLEEKKMSPVTASEVAKEAEPVVSSRLRGTNADRNAKKSFADQGANPQLPAATISGVVTSAEDGSPLPGVNVVLKGTTIGTITDVEGRFKLDSATIASTLVYSFIGLQTKEMNVTNFNPLNVALNADVTQLSEVVVTGYGYSNTNENTPTVDLAHPEIGNRAYRKHLEENIIYPQSAIDNKIEGRVTVEFFVETNGSLSDFTIVRGIGGGCDEELIRLIRQGPKWVPTKKDNLPIRDKARVRLNFQLPGK